MSRRGDSGHRYETYTYLDMGTSPGVCSGLKIVTRHGRHDNDNILFVRQVLSASVSGLPDGQTRVHWRHSMVAVVGSYTTY